MDDYLFLPRVYIGISQHTSWQTMALDSNYHMPSTHAFVCWILFCENLSCKQKAFRGFLQYLSDQIIWRVIPSTRIS